ncbi:hypothetical protein CWI36_0676p0010 [Hamiltosporidium magnivora]|uniref:DDE-like endonuclease n=1 Tax=Hamiltosporidium magnivora TaxID=148818 RepID=A0A4Q9L649_9MICR|nr:DDE-like endonuclease [Hamiltosporidium magnivora]TBU05089.1 hypothetical protein CWI36_0676p0010 [Hamiltosporidium magnivora]
MSNSFSVKNTNENKYDFHVGETPECIECKNDNCLKRLVETPGSHDENLLLTTIPTLRKQMVSINDRKGTIEKPLEAYSMSAIASMYRINYQTVNSIVRRYLKTGLVFVEKSGSDKRSKLTLEIKESLQTYVDLNVRKTLYENILSKIELRTNYEASFRELEVDNDDKNFVFLDEVGFSVVTRPSRGRNMRGESAYLSVTAARSRNISVVAAMNKYGMIYHKIHERAVNGEDFKLFIKEIYESCQRQGILTPIFVMDNARIHHYRGLNDDEEIASYRIKYLPPYSPFLNPIENVLSV